MTNLTLAIEDEVFERLRLVAARRNATVDDLVREALARLAPNEDSIAEPSLSQDRIAEARKGLLELMDRSTGRMAADYKFDREEIYDR